MVRVIEDDDGVLLGVVTSDLDRVLDCLCARVEERGALLVVAGGELVELLGDVDVALVGGDGEAGVRELLDLGDDCLDDLGCRVANAGHGDARAEVDERVAVNVNHDAAASSDDGDGECDADASGDRCVLACEHLLRLRAGDAGDELALLRE